MPGAVGPQQSITCPAGSINIAPGTSIASTTNAYPAGTSFCLLVGVHSVTGPIVPKTGNTYTGQYGAILDGSGWSSTDTNTGAFRADGIMPARRVDNVTIRNVVIRNMPQRGIKAMSDVASGWVIDHNEVHANKVGINVGVSTVVSNNFIHHNVGNPTSSNRAERGGGYGGYRASDVLFVGNEIAYNGPEQKMVGTQRVSFVGNYVHHNIADGIWFDTDNVDFLVERNQVSDNGRDGISTEISGRGVIRNNVSERNNGSGIFISTSKDEEIYGNVVRDNRLGGIKLWLTASAVGGGSIGFDLANNYIHDNEIRMSGGTTGFGSPVTAIYYSLPGKSNRFVANRYIVGNTSGRYWEAGGSRTFTEWRALGQDANSTAGT